MGKKILIIEDEPDIVELIAYNLGIEGFDTEGLLDGGEALPTVLSYQPDLIILDIMLPGMNGIEICKALKNTSKTKDIPIIMLSAKSEELDVILGLELGAVDYITKPFSPKVLIARVKAALRQLGARNEQPTENIVLNGLKIDVERREVYINEKKIKFTYSEFQTLLLLASNRGKVFSRNKIAQEVHGYDYIVSDRAIDVLIVTMRKKLENCADMLETVRGVGYRIK
jgi:two-component system phosphate regulon response regulator PhoB